MLTVDFDRLGVKPGDRAIDIGAGADVIPSSCTGAARTSPHSIGVRTT